MKVLDEKIIEACTTSLTMAIACNKVEMPFSSFKRRAQSLGVYIPNQGGKGTYRPLKSLQDVFDGKYGMKPSHLKYRLILEGYKKYECEDCGIGDEYNGKALVHELEHINGNNKDNRLENIKILCPNCHSQTPTFRGRKRI